MADVDKEMNPILKKGNYEYWRTMTEASLVFLGCWDAVQPGFTPAEMMKPECIKMDNKARGIFSGMYAANTLGISEP